MRHPLRLAIRAAVAAAAVATLTACAPMPTVCPAIGYLSTLEIVIEGTSAERAHSVELCTDDVCGPSRAASDAGLLMTLDGVSGTTWTFTGDFPEVLILKVYDEDRAPLSESRLDATWTRTGGTAECGGPHSGTATIRL